MPSAIGPLKRALTDIPCQNMNVFRRVSHAPILPSFARIESLPLFGPLKAPLLPSHAPKLNVFAVGFLNSALAVFSCSENECLLQSGPLRASIRHLNYWQSLDDLSLLPTNVAEAANQSEAET